MKIRHIQTIEQGENYSFVDDNVMETSMKKCMRPNERSTTKTTTNSLTFFSRNIADFYVYKQINHVN